MSKGTDLESYIAHLAAEGLVQSELASLIKRLAGAGRMLAELIASGAAKRNLAGYVRTNNGSGDQQTKLDLIANEIVIAALAGAPVAWLASEESEAPIAINPGAPFSIAVDPLDGSSNIETNAPIGTIFSIVPTSPCGGSEPTFLQPGTRQVAAGFFVYGPQCTLMLTLGRGTAAFTLDPESAKFVLGKATVAISEVAREFAVNSSNARHWSSAISAYVSECVMGADGPRGRDFNMRWIASLVAEAQRILVRGGVYLYPRDQRSGYENGRLRLVYEANPIAFVIEQAGGAANDGATRILDLRPAHIHQKTPLIFGSRGEVELIGRYAQGLEGNSRPHQLFSDRGLLRH